MVFDVFVKCDSAIAREEQGNMLRTDGLTEWIEGISD